MSYKASRLLCVLRVVGEDIETSYGEHVPISVAPGLWRLVQHCITTARPFSALDALRDGHHTHAEDLSVGTYPLNHISAQGDLVIGGQTISYSEIERIAVALGLKDEL